MCGIVAVFNKHSSVAQEDLISAIKLLNHRGPDQQTVWIAKNSQVALCHARLNIIDLFSGHQPLHSENQKIHLIVNGEFYEYKKIRTKMEKNGHKFSTNSDSELLLALYQQFGYNCLNFLNGEFSFVLWDEEKNLVFAARDRFGIKPLYYSIYEGNLYFASEIKALIKLGIPAIFDEEYFLSIACGIPSQIHSCFKNIIQIKAGHYLVANVQQQRFTEHEYWDWKFPPERLKENLSEEEYIKNFEQLFRQAVKRRLHADVPVGCYLSGGIDSASILAIMTEETQSKIAAFNVSFIESDKHNEYDAACIMAKYVDANFYSLPVTIKDIAENYQQAVWHRESYLIGGNAVAKYLLSKTANNHGYKVVLTGEGADEMLGGYPFLREDFKYSPANNLSQIEMIENPFSALISAEFNDTIVSPHRYKSVRAMLGYYPTWLKTHCNSNINKNLLYSEQLIKKFQHNDPVLAFLKSFNLDQNIDPINMSLYLWAKSFFYETILKSLGDRMEMAHSVEGRLPFLDINLVNFLATLPINLKLGKKTEKYILREAMKDKIPKEMYFKPKHPFLSPPANYYGKLSPIYKLMEEVFFSDLLNNLPFINPQVARKILHDFPNMKGKNMLATEALLHILLSGCFLMERFNIKRK